MADVQEGVVPQPPLPPLRRNRDFILLWSGQVVSSLGTRVTSVAYPLLVLADTGSPARAGVVGFAQTLPFLVLYLPAGALVDRWDRKGIMVVSDAGRALALGTLAVSIALGEPPFLLLVVVAFVEGSLFVFFNLAEGAALPRIVSRPQLPTAVAQNEARLHGADLVGQPLGGLLFGISRSLPFVFDAATYAVSSVALLFVRVPPSGDHPSMQRRLAADMAEGVRWLWHQPFLRMAVALISGSNFAFNALTLVLIVRARELGASPALIGALLAFYGVGGLLGALIAPATQRLLPARAILVGATWLWAILTAALVLVGSPLLLGALAGLASVAGPPFNVILSRFRYALVPDQLQGRVLSVGRLVAWGSIPLGVLSAGVLLEAFGARTSFALLAGVMAVVATGASVAPSMRNLPSLDSEPVVR